MLEPPLIRHLFAVLVLCVSAPAIRAAEVPSVRVGRFGQQVATRHSVDEGLPSPDVRRIVLSDDGQVLAETTAGWAMLGGGRWRPTGPPSLPSFELPEVPRVRARATSPSGAEAIASGDGLFSRAGSDAEWRRLWPSDGRRSWAPRNVRDVAFDRRGGLWFVSPQGVGHCPAPCRTWRLYSTETGLPYDDLTAIAPGPA